MFFMQDEKKIKEIVIKNLKKYFLLFITFIFPERMITTFFGLGYLPDWQNHWTGFFVIPFVGLVIHFTVGFASSITTIIFVLFIVSILLFFIGMLSIHLFQKFNRYTKYEITIHVAFGQTMMIFLSVPAILQFINKIFAFNGIVCNQFLFCANWFFYTATYFAGMLVPYFIFRLVDILKPWPSYIIDRDHDHYLSYMFEGLFNAIYASMLIYLLAFLLLDLNVMVVINTYRSLW